jgi:hypothetical protein
MLYIVGMMISNTCEQQQLLGTNDTTLLHQLLTPPITDWSNPIAGIGSLIAIPIYYVGLILRIATFDFAIFYGSWVYVRYLFCAIGIGMIVGWIIVLRGVHSQ